MKKILLIIFLFSLIFILTPSKIKALSCISPPSIEEWFEYTDAIVIAKVEEIKEGSSRYNDVILNISKSYKGVNEKTITMKEMADWGTSAVGEEYLLYLQKTEDAWVNASCYSMLAKHADVELKFLENKQEIKLHERNKDVASFMYFIVFFVVVGILILCFKLIRKYKK
ncbi:hypothetical protein ACK8P5_12615 [Paenibacillus sp. EC2-1]|uniref:hypothetical protein n=1 Tax=Paenibacillus sp. EC2-1 TaxID=3388665 RepID=UPI003BEEB6CE